MDPDPVGGGFHGSDVLDVASWWGWVPGPIAPGLALVVSLVV
ncbi:MAG: hypothetical protein ACFCUP_03385 [Actinomycetales bacterium]